MIIYRITNLINGKMYVGLSKYSTPNIRWSQHQHLALKKNSKYPLHKAIRKYGNDNFKVDILENIKEIPDLLEREKFWIKELKTFQKGYNATLGGEGRFGSSPSKITKEKISQSLKKRKLSEEHKKKIGEANKIANQNSETKKRRAWGNKNRTITQKARLNMSRAQKKRYANHD